MLRTKACFGKQTTFLPCLKRARSFTVCGCKCNEQAVTSFCGGANHNTFCENLEWFQLIWVYSTGSLLKQAFRPFDPSWEFDQILKMLLKCLLLSSSFDMLFLEYLSRVSIYMFYVIYTVYSIYTLYLALVTTVPLYVYITCILRLTPTCYIHKFCTFIGRLNMVKSLTLFILVSRLMSHLPGLSASHLRGVAGNEVIPRWLVSQHPRHHPSAHRP